MVALFRALNCLLQHKPNHLLEAQVGDVMLPHPLKLFLAGAVKPIVIKAVNEQAKRREVKLQWALTVAKGQRAAYSSCTNVEFVFRASARCLAPSAPS